MANYQIVVKDGQTYKVPVKKKSGGGCLSTLVTFVFFAALAGGAYYIYAYTDLLDSLFGTPEDEGDNSGPGITGEGIRALNGTGWIELYFNNESTITVNQQASYLQAADYWSEVLKDHVIYPTSDNSIYPRLNFANTIQQLCPNAGLEGNFTINGGEVIDHLIIYVDFFSENSNVLGRAGPCYCQRNSPPTAGPDILGSCGFLDTTLIPLIGNMKFNSAQTASSDYATVLHEMGHVLGIGTLWDNKGLLDNKITSFPLTGFETKPTYSGVNGVAAYDVLVPGETKTSVPVEDGVDGAGSVILSLNGGNINGHWDKDEMKNELMTYQISYPSVTTNLTILSLIDLGYTVDASLAEAPDQNFLSASNNLRGSTITFVDDMYLPPRPE